jgi:hypothetical protein
MIVEEKFDIEILFFLLPFQNSLLQCATIQRLLLRMTDDDSPLGSSCIAPGGLCTVVSRVALSRRV